VEKKQPCTRALGLTLRDGIDSGHDFRMRPTNVHIMAHTMLTLSICIDPLTSAGSAGEPSCIVAAGGQRGLPAIVSHTAAIDASLAVVTFFVL